MKTYLGHYDGEVLPSRIEFVPIWYKLLEVSYEDRYYKGRDYELFNALCGVRGNGDHCISEPKGLPDDVSEPVKWISDQWGDDAHSHNYNTLRELEDYDWKQVDSQARLDFARTIKRMRREIGFGSSHLKVPEDHLKDCIRLVYFFDN